MGTTPDGNEPLQEVLQRLERMEARIEELRQQVNVLQSRPAHLPAPPPPPPHPVAAPLPPRPAAAPPTISDTLREKQAAEEQAAEEPREPQPPPPAAVPAPARPAASDNWEAVALLWMGRAGIAALFFGIAFFLQYAFRNGWIGPAGQVGIGLLAGVVMIASGLANRHEDRRNLAEALMGGGLAILYLSLYAAYALYQPALLEHLHAFAAMAVVTLLGALVALRKDSQPTAVLTTLGGFLTPLVLRQTGGSGDLAAQYATLIQLFGYLTILNLGLLGLSLVRQWRSVQILSFAGSWLLMWGWIDGLSGTALNFTTAQAMAVIFAIYLLVPVVRNLWLRQPSEPTDAFLILANPSLFFTTTVLLMWHMKETMGLYAVVMALLYFALGTVGHRRSPADRLVFLSWLGLGVGFMILAIPLQFEGRWIMIGWGIEAVLLVWMGHQLRSIALRGAGMVMHVVVFGWLVLLYQLESTHGVPGWVPFGNPLFLSFAGGTATVVATLLLYLYTRPKAEEAGQAVPVLGVGIAVLALCGVTAEMLLVPLTTQWIMLYWAAAALLVVWLGLQRLGRAVLVAGLLLQFVVAGWLLLLYELSHQSGEMPFVNTVFLCFTLAVLSLGATLALLAREGKVLADLPTLKPLFVTVLCFLSVWGLTAETLHSLHWLPSSPQYQGYAGVTGFAVSILWCLCAVALIGIGMVLRYALTRKLGVLLFAVAIAKVFLYDSSALQTIWRVLSFVCLGLILIAVSYLYHLYRERVKEFMGR